VIVGIVVGVIVIVAAVSMVRQILKRREANRVPVKEARKAKKQKSVD
jgi:MFS superfamily sulfate permease-like transporter